MSEQLKRLSGERPAWSVRAEKFEQELMQAALPLENELENEAEESEVGAELRAQQEAMLRAQLDGMVYFFADEAGRAFRNLFEVPAHVQVSANGSEQLIEIVADFYPVPEMLAKYNFGSVVSMAAQERVARLASRIAAFQHDLLLGQMLKEIAPAADEFQRAPTHALARQIVALASALRSVFPRTYTFARALRELRILAKRAQTWLQLG